MCSVLLSETSFHLRLLQYVFYRQLDGLSHTFFVSTHKSKLRIDGVLARESLLLSPLIHLLYKKRGGGRVGTRGSQSPVLFPPWQVGPKPT